MPSQRPTPTTPRPKPRQKRATSQPLAQHWVHLVHARRCPGCGASLRALRPVREGSLAAATVVARVATSSHRPATSGDLARAYSTAARPFTPERASQHLTRAVEDGLLQRVRLTLPRGGVRYLYEPVAALVAYVEQDGLAADLGHHLGLPAILESISRAAQRATQLPSLTD